MKKILIALVISVCIVGIISLSLPDLFQRPEVTLLLTPFWFYSIHEYLKTFESGRVLGTTVLLGTMWSIVILCAKRYGVHVNNDAALFVPLAINHVMWFTIGYLTDAVMISIEKNWGLGK
ncbi:hypothetical protein bcgnr5378_29450 [Bacillus cereus]|uniref:hypothetical protein n=1 Tax=Bacillus cereus TaxID=1396 RepID=UPI0007AB600E|nr:hypothetical protein [Bacillus cereus]HDR8324868.1 hypothetical protein [Bacillus cereus]HDR8331453.1 hypothetical protein [Bacillus cereus]HDR8332921.1 hypothetical protein [Bacillus cereus]